MSCVFLSFFCHVKHMQLPAALCPSAVTNYNKVLEKKMFYQQKFE